MKIKRYLVLILILALLSGCGSAPQILPAPPETAARSEETAAELTSVPESETEETQTEAPPVTAAEPETTEAETTPEALTTEAETPAATTEEQATETPADPAEATARDILAGMSTEDKVAQLFIVAPEALTGMDQVTAAGEATRNAFDRRPVGGLIYFEPNLLSWDQTADMLSAAADISLERTGLVPFLCLDEEGGIVTRISKRGFGVADIPGMGDVGSRGDVSEARELGDTMGSYLSELGFNMDFAPCADTLTNPDNQVVRGRSFGSDPQLVSEMCAAIAEGLAQHGVLACYKHFPGHGATAGDTHAGYAYTDKTLDELKAEDLIPFIDGIANGVPVIMIGHISLPNVLPDETPASLSHELITGLLREDLGYDGLIVTDALAMGAIANQYSSAEAAVRAITAGADLLLMPLDFGAAYQGMLDALANGTISQERLNESVLRIITAKLSLS